MLEQRMDQAGEWKRRYESQLDELQRRIQYGDDDSEVVKFNCERVTLFNLVLSFIMKKGQFTFIS